MASRLMNKLDQAIRLDDDIILRDVVQVYAKKDARFGYGQYGKVKVNPNETVKVRHVFGYMWEKVA